MSLTEREESDDPDPKSQARALHLRAAAGEITEPEQILELITLILDQPGTTRSYASSALTRVAKRHPTLVQSHLEDLIKLAQSANDEIATVGLQVLASIELVDVEHITMVVEIARSKLAVDNPATKKAALASIAALGESMGPVIEDIREQLEESLAHPNGSVRSAAVTAVGAIVPQTNPPDRELVVSLLPRLNDEQNRVRLQAHRALVEIAIEHPTAIPEPWLAVDQFQTMSDEQLNLETGTIDRAISALPAGRAGDHP